MLMAEHSMCQPGRPGSPRRVPRRLAGLRALPQGEVARVPFGIVGLVSSAGPHVLGPLTGQRTVLRVRADVEVHAAAGRIGVTTLDQPPHQGDHLGYMPGRPGFDVGGKAAEHVVGPAERALVALRHQPPGHSLGGGDTNDLVVDVGDVPAERGLVPGCPQPADEDVENNAGPDVPDVWRCLHCGAAQVQPGLPGRNRGELAHLARGGVVEAERHAAKGTG